jgi:hypothetical protein
MRKASVLAFTKRKLNTQTNMGKCFLSSIRNTQAYTLSSFEGGNKTHEGGGTRGAKKTRERRRRSAKPLSGSLFSRRRRRPPQKTHTHKETTPKNIKQTKNAQALNKRRSAKTAFST